MNTGLRREPPAGHDTRDRRQAARLRARRFAAVFARLIVAVPATALAVGAVVAIRLALSHGLALLWLALGAMQAVVVGACVFSLLYGTQLYWLIGWLEVSIARRIEARLTAGDRSRD